MFQLHVDDVDIGFFRPSTGFWFILRSLTTEFSVRQTQRGSSDDQPPGTLIPQFGFPIDIPVPRAPVP